MTLRFFYGLGTPFLLVPFRTRFPRFCGSFVASRRCLAKLNKAHKLQTDFNTCRLQCFQLTAFRGVKDGKRKILMRCLNTYQDPGDLGIPNRKDRTPWGKADVAYRYPVSATCKLGYELCAICRMHVMIERLSASIRRILSLGGDKFHDWVSKMAWLSRTLCLVYCRSILVPPSRASTRPDCCLFYSQPQARACQHLLTARP